MKIERFNENNNNINWNENKINEFVKLKTNVKNMEDSFKKLILKYLQLNPNLQRDATENEDFIDDDAINDPDSIEEFEINTNNPYTKIYIKYFPNCDHYYSDPFEAEIPTKKYPDFLEFLQNPDIYNSTKKYNL